jgi:lysophospholipase L1-like esterase
VTVLIGANDLTSAPSSLSWLESLFAYVDPLRASGIKVAVGTILPQHIPGNSQYNQLFNARRAEVNNALRAKVGARIDAVIDFAADPEMGPDSAAINSSLYRDGVHPTDGCGIGCGGQGKLARVYIPVVDDLLTDE